MKKVFLTAAVGAIAFSANAQQTRFGIEVGAHLGNLLQELPEVGRVGGSATTFRKEHVDGRPNLGLRAGLVADIGLSDNFSIQPGLQFVMKGVRNEFSIDSPIVNTEYQEKMNINYIEVPLNVMYKTREDGTGFMVGAGPYFGYAFGGKRVSQINNVELSSDELSFGDNADDDIKNLDVGVGINVGYMLPVGVFVRGYGQYSFSNIYPVPEAKYETKNYGFGISVGYMFGGKKGVDGSGAPTDAAE